MRKRIGLLLLVLAVLISSMLVGCQNREAEHDDNIQKDNHAEQTNHTEEERTQPEQVTETQPAGEDKGQPDTGTEIDASSAALTEEEASFVGVWSLSYGYNANKEIVQQGDESAFTLSLNDDLTGTLDDGSQNCAFTWSYTGTNEAAYGPGVYYMNFKAVFDSVAVFPSEEPIEEFGFDVDTRNSDTIYVTLGDWLYLGARIQGSGNTNSTEIADSNNADSTEYQIEDLNGSIRVPDGYYVFGEDIDFTDQMCRDISIDPANMRDAIFLLQGQTLIVPSDAPYADSIHFYLKVKEKKYDDITLFDLSMSDYHLIASTIVSSFGVNTYDTVEGNGLRFFVFEADQGLGNVLRYATILNGHMVYVYANIGNNAFDEQQKADLESIALSIIHGL